MPGELHDGAVGRERAAQDREAARRLQRACRVAQDLLPRRLTRGRRLGRERPAVDRDGIAEEARLGESAREETRAAGARQVGRGEAAARLQIGEERGPPRNRVEVVERERNARLVRDREEMEDGVRGAARRDDRRDRVLEGFARQDPARGEAFGEKADHERARLARDGVLPRVRRRHVVRAHRRQAEERESGRHRVRGELAAARAGAGAGGLLDHREVVVVEAPRGVRADGLEDVLDRDVAAADGARQDRAAVEDERGDVEARERHRARGDRLVASDEDDGRVERVTSHGELDRIRDHLARDERGAHAGGAHRDAVGDRDGVELDRRPAGGAHACLHESREPAEVHVARRHLGPCVRDRHERALDLGGGQARRAQHGASRRARGALLDGIAEHSRPPSEGPGPGVSRGSPATSSRCGAWDET